MKIMSHPDGKIALLNDSAFGETAGVEALETYATSLGIRSSDVPASLPTDGHGRRSSENRGAVPLFLAETGYLRVDCGDMAAFLDVAPIGPDWLPGHAHADTLTFELSLGRQRLIVDSGTSRYGEGPERLRQRGTAAHNTVAIDGADSSEVWGGFRVARRAYPQGFRIEAAKKMGSDPTFSTLVVSCAHDGYRRLPGKPIHRREWRFGESRLQIRDVIEGSFREAVGYLHFHPDLRVIADPAGREGGGENAAARGLLPLPGCRQLRWQVVKGQAHLADTTWHPEFGKAIPNQCLESFEQRLILVGGMDFHRKILKGNAERGFRVCPWIPCLL